MQELITHGASVTKPKRDGMTTFHVAASNNDVQMLDYLIELNQHDTVDIKNQEGWTPALLAGVLDNFDSLNLLLEHGADLTEKHNANLNCYEEMVRTDNAELFECIYPLIQEREDQRSLKGEGTYSLLHLAAGSSGP